MFGFDVEFDRITMLSLILCHMILKNANLEASIK